MNKSLLRFIVIAGVAVTGIAQAAPLNATLVMGQDRSWRGQLLKRDGDWIEFSTGTPKPIRVGASTIKELIFDLKVDVDALSEMKKNREYERIIGLLDRALAPYQAYSDIPSDLARFNALLMELHYKTENYPKTIQIAKALSNDDRDDRLQQKARIYHALALIDSGRQDDAAKLMASFGWAEKPEDDAAPELLYIAAKMKAASQQYADAMELVAKVIAFNSQDPEWMQPAELLCAQIYAELGKTNPVMLDSAEEVIRQISLLYKNTNEDDLAQKLKIEIDGLRAMQDATTEESE